AVAKKPAAKPVAKKAVAKKPAAKPVAKKAVAKKPVEVKPATPPSTAAAPGLKSSLNPAAAWPFPTGSRP
ncbi:MAG: histone, partial [Betaproteobacteria bacterium HGW-Betaproteobacteria-11]